MQTARDLFVHELQDILDGEQRLVEALGEQEQMSTNDQLESAFAAHREQTEGQVERLKQAFEMIGEQPEETECKGIQGLVEEVHSFMQEDPSEDLVDVFNVGAAIKVENYEINAYESLIDMAEELGFDRAAKLLKQNLKEEEQTLKKMESFHKKIKPENLGVAEEEEAPARGRRRRVA